jgi:8-oxo-dGTP pyrophosphatase MutT (NUDIX family)
MTDLITFLTRRLSHGLPGRPSQIKMAPKPVSGGQARKMEAPEHAHQSSVLVLLFPNHENKIELTLTLRSNDIDHGGQISFPGGRAEEGETAVETALREAHEEIGICSQDVSILGKLSELYVNHSNNRVIPIVGFMERRPEFNVNPDEVEEIFTVELDSLLLKKNLTVEDWDLRSHTYKVPYWDVHRVPLWGATAMMLSELLDLYREFLREIEEKWPPEKH